MVAVSAPLVPPSLSAEPSLIVVAIVSVPNSTFSTPPPCGLEIMTLYISSPSAYASSTVPTSNVISVPLAGIVTCVVAIEMSPLSAEL